MTKQHNSHINHKPANRFGLLGFAMIVCTSLACATGSAYATMTSTPVPSDLSDCTQVDKKLATVLKQSFENSAYNYSVDKTPNYGNTETANQLAATILTTYTQQPKSIACQFPNSANEGLTFATSVDNRFRVYTWDENTGGTMHFYSALVQYLDDKGKSHGLYEQSWSELSASTNRVAGRLYELATVETDTKPFYILASHSIGSNRDRAIFIKLFQIKDGKLISPKLIRTNSRYTDEVSFGYDAVSLAENNIESPLFEFNKSDNSFSFPVVLASDTFYSGEVTNNRIVYRFDGQYFQRIKN